MREVEREGGRGREGGAEGGRKLRGVHGKKKGGNKRGGERRVQREERQGRWGRGEKGKSGGQAGFAWKFHMISLCVHVLTAMPCPVLRTTL